MDTSLYQQIKIDFLSFIDLSKDAVHIHIGILIFILWIVLAKQPMKSFKSLIPVIIAALTMEILDCRDDYNSFGYIRWGASIHDFINTTVWPFIFVLLSRLRLIKTSKDILK